MIGGDPPSKAAGLFNTAVNADSSLAALRAAAEGAGPVAVNSVPPSVVISKAAPHAVTALSSGYSTGFLVVAIAALVCWSQPLPGRPDQARARKITMIQARAR